MGGPISAKLEYGKATARSGAFPELWAACVDGVGSWLRG